MREPNFQKLIHNSRNCLWLLRDDREYYLIHCFIQQIEECGRSWKFTVETFLPSNPQVDLIHNSKLAVCFAECGRPDYFRLSNVILYFSNCAEIGRRYNKVTGYEQERMLLEIDFVTGNLISFDRE